MGAMSITTRDGTRQRAGERPTDAPSGPGLTARLRSPAGRRRAGAGARAAAEGAVVGWLCAVVPAVAAYAATAALPALGDATWTDAAAVGAAAWRLALGAPADAGDGVTVTVVPLGLTVLVTAILMGALRRARVASWTGAAAGVAAYVASAAVLALLAPVGPRRPGDVLAGAAVVGTIAALTALGRRRQGFPPLGAEVRGLVDRTPRVVAALAPHVVLGAGRALGLLVGIGGILAVVSLSASTAGFAAVLDGLRVDRASAVVVTLASLSLLPTFAVWGVAWLAGPGFAVGSGTVFAPDGVVSGPLPALPALAGLPAPGTAAADVPWAPLAVVAVGAALGWWLHRRLPRAGAGRSVGSAAAATAVVALLVAGATALLALASSGSVGPGRMSEVGPDALAVAIAVAVELGLGALVVVVVAHPDVRALAARWLGAARRRGAALRPGTGGSDHRVTEASEPQGVAEPPGDR